MNLLTSMLSWARNGHMTEDEFLKRIRDRRPRWRYIADGNGHIRISSIDGLGPEVAIYSDRRGPVGLDLNQQAPQCAEALGLPHRLAVRYCRAGEGNRIDYPREWRMLVEATGLPPLTPCLTEKLQREAAAKAGARFRAETPEFLHSAHTALLEHQAQHLIPAK